MQYEIASIADLLRAQADVIAEPVSELVNVLSRRSLSRSNQRYYSIGWGSSACMARWFQYVAANLCAWPIMQWPMALEKEKAAVLLDSASCLLAFSQSGSSTDLCDVMRIAAKSDGIAIACVNKKNSVLAEIASHVLPVAAGEEKSIAATKSFFLSATAILYLFAKLNDDAELLHALKELPVQLEDQEKITLYTDPFLDIPNLFVLGHAYAESIGSEVALKFKETCLIHSEAMSYSSFMHGPVGLLAKPTNILTLLQDDMNSKAVSGALQKLIDFGAAPLCIAPAGVSIPRDMTMVAQCLSSSHPACSSLLLLHQSYRLIAQLMQQLNLDPNDSAFLNKETITE